MLSRVAILSVALLGTTGCAMNWSERTTGTLIGAAGGGALGALVGSAAGSPWLGAGIGAAAGGTAGYIIGDKMADKRERAQAAPRASGSGAGPEASSFPPPAPDIEPAPAPGPVRPYPAPRGPDVMSTSRPTGDPRALARAEYEAGRASTTAETALRHYDSAIRLDPTRPEPYHARGMVLQYEGRRDEARRAYAQSLAIDPTYAPAEQGLRALPAR